MPSCSCTYVFAFHSRDVVTDVPDHNGDEDVGGAELGQMAITVDDLDDGFPPEVLVQVLGDADGHGHVLPALEDVAGDLDKVKHWPHVALEDGLEYAEGNVGSDVEEGAAELLHRDRVQVPSHGQRGEPGHPCPEVGPYGVEQLHQIFCLEPSAVVLVAKKPEL